MGCQKLTYSDYFAPNLRVLRGYASKPIDRNMWQYQWDLIHDPQNMLFAWAQDESEAEMAYDILDDYAQNKQVEIAYWKIRNENKLSAITVEILQEEYLLNNDYKIGLFECIKIDISNLESRDPESAKMLEILVEKGNIDDEVLTALIKERHYLAEYQRITVPLLLAADILSQYCTILSISIAPTSIPAVGNVGKFISNLSGVKAMNAASRVATTYAELQPGKWIMHAGKLFMKGSVVDAGVQVAVNVILEDDFSEVVSNIDFSSIAITGVTNTITGGSVTSLRKLFKSGSRVAVIKGMSIVTLELTSSSLEWTPFDGSDQYKTIFDGDVSSQEFFCSFILSISGDVLPEEMVDIFKRWAKSDFDVRWYSTLTSSEKEKVEKIYNIINSTSFENTIETNATFIEAFINDVINNDDKLEVKTVSVEDFELELPNEYVQPSDNTNIIIPWTINGN